MEEQNDVTVTNKLGIMRTDFKEGYLMYLLCQGGTCCYLFNGKEFKLHAGTPSVIHKRKNDRKDKVER